MSIQEKLNKNKKILKLTIFSLLIGAIIFFVLMPLIIIITSPHIPDKYMNLIRYLPFSLLLILIPLIIIERKRLRLRMQILSENRSSNTPAINQTSNQILNQNQNTNLIQEKLNKTKKIVKIIIFSVIIVTIIFAVVIPLIIINTSPYILDKYLNIIIFLPFSLLFILIPLRFIQRKRLRLIMQRRSEDGSLNTPSINQTSNQILNQNQDLYKKEVISLQDKHSNNQKYCHVCGKKLEPGATYCKSCWADVQ